MGIGRADFSDAANWQTAPEARTARESKRPMIGDDGDIDEATADAAIGQTEKRASIRRELRQLWSELPKPNKREVTE
jgi:hypothetical protein